MERTPNVLAHGSVKASNRAQRKFSSRVLSSVLRCGLRAAHRAAMPRPVPVVEEDVTEVWHRLR
eukprot:2443432-Pyramimonas_sp.AAC.1